MTPEAILALLEKVRAGAIDPTQALENLKELPFAGLGYAHVDTHRALRNGYPEVIFGAGKTTAQITGVARKLREHGHSVFVTRLDDNQGEALVHALPGAVYDPVSHTLRLLQDPPTPRGVGPIAVVCAGTSDIPVAEEAAVTIETMGHKAERLFDVGVAGLHRLLGHQPLLRRATVLVAVAGMEGALPGVVRGLVERPVIAVPTSIGYGASFHGLAALLGMLNACSSGVAVVNIDNGFGAAMMACTIDRFTRPPGVTDGTSR